MEDNQIFPLVSIVTNQNTNNTTRQENEDNNGAREIDEIGDEESQRQPQYFSGVQQQIQKSYIQDEGNPSNIEENRNPGMQNIRNFGREKNILSCSATGMTSSPIKSTRSSVGRGILSRKGPIKVINFKNYYFLIENFRVLRNPYKTQLEALSTTHTPRAITKTKKMILLNNQKT